MNAILFRIMNKKFFILIQLTRGTSGDNVGDFNALFIDCIYAKKKTIHISAIGP